MGDRQEPDRPSQSAVPKFSVEQFTKIRKIGRGPKSEVWLVHDSKSASHFALKQLHRDAFATKEEVEHVWNERRVLESLAQEEPSFPRVCQLMATLKDDMSLYFVLEFIPGAPLHKHFQAERGFDHHRARFYSAELAEILGELHDRGVIYRDLKASNVMVDGRSGRLRLVDFGFAKQLSNASAGASKLLHRTASVCGTFHAMAPEVRNQGDLDPDRPGYTVAADWWSLGVLVFEMITTRPPFGYRDGDNDGRSIRVLAAESPASIVFPRDVLASNSNAGRFVSDLLQAEPTARLGYTGAEEVKAHDWFHDFNWALAAVERAKEAWTDAIPEFDETLGEFVSSDSSGDEHLDKIPTA